jgi:hypothetical protein
VYLFYVLLTVHLGIILVRDQTDAQFFFYMSTAIPYMFEQPHDHHPENQLYQYNIWYVSVCVGDRLTRILDGHLHRVTYTRFCIDTIDSPDDEHEVARNM